MATLTTSSLSHLSNSVRVDVRLCGSVPRQEMQSLSLCRRAPMMPSDMPLSSDLMDISESNLIPSESWDSSSSSTHRTLQSIDTSRMASELCSQLSSMERFQRPSSVQHIHRKVAPTFEAPAWAVPARGEARLEPICESTDTQSPVDLSQQSVYQVGRSPSSDVHLLHATSSRRHALLFHHSNGSCYIVDCGSAHGTYVNGIRVTSPPNGGVVVPHRVRRGSIIRFGGIGAPSFMLKSFAFDLEELRENPVSSTRDLPSACAMGAVVQHNTRVNSLGRTAKDSLVMSLSSKRSFDSIETVESEDSMKRMRCSSPFLSPEEPLRLVSPDACLQPSKRRRVSFSAEPPTTFYSVLISPNLSSDENDCDSV